MIQKMRSPAGKISGLNATHISESNAGIQSFAYFLLAMLGFSFWFFMAVPFATHRESYEWLGLVYSQDFAKAFSFISVTYRPLAQGVTWTGFEILNPNGFPTSSLRQVLLQGFIYGMFVLAWWLIYSAATQKRLFALLACATGGVFFSGYIHLFHIYGIFYVPVMLTLGALLRFHFHTSSPPHKREIWFAVVAILLAFWHPFATALFAGFYFGFYLETFWQRSRSEHFRALVILLLCTTAIAALVVLFPTRVEPLPHLDARLVGFLVSYHTNEINVVTSLVAFLLTQ